MIQNSFNTYLAHIDKKALEKIVPINNDDAIEAEVTEKKKKKKKK